MAFQPIINLAKDEIWGYEALVRGTEGQGAGEILARVTDEELYAFDQACRVKAIELAGPLLSRETTRLSINFMPNAVYEPRACIQASLKAAERVGLDRRRLMFEFTENERMPDVAHVRNIVDEYRRIGFTTALDDFGAGYAGLALLAHFRPDLIKIDMELIRGVESDPARQAIVRGLLAICADLSVTVLAEGVETEAESRYLARAGITLQQGYHFARPTLAGSLPN